MTIELGFAELTVGDTRFGVVDVPGHEKFVRTMVAGATGIDIAVLVVAADDSVMPQTVEHVEILDLLGVRRGVVALTKIDVVDPSLIPLVTEEVRELLVGTCLHGAAICPVSSITGAGLDDLKAAIVAVSAGIERGASRSPFRMAVDRVFTVQGRGTVVTGSVLGGQVAAGDVLEVFPAGKTGRVRDLQAHGVQSDQLARGQRAAINLGGIEKEDVHRGSEVATPGYLQPSRIIDVRVRCLPSFGRALKSTATVRLEVGATEVPVRIVFHDRPTLAPGEAAYAQLRSGTPITVVYGQHFILRDDSAMRTIGGGTILRPVARRKRGEAADEVERLGRMEQGTPMERMEEVLRAAGFARPTDLQLCARAGVGLNEPSELLTQLESAKKWMRIGETEVRATPSTLSEVGERLARWMERFHRGHPEQPGRPLETVVGWLERIAMNRALGKPLADLFLGDKTIKAFGRFVCLPAFAPALSAGDERQMQSIIAEIRKSGFQPPALGELNSAQKVDRKRLQGLVTLAVAGGELVAVGPELYLHAESERELRTTVAELVGRAGPVTVAQVREALGSSRKFVVPFLEYLDRIGFTRRVGDQRVLRANDEKK